MIPTYWFIAYSVVTLAIAASVLPMRYEKHEKRKMHDPFSEALFDAFLTAVFWPILLGGIAVMGLIHMWLLLCSSTYREKHQRSKAS